MKFKYNKVEIQNRQPIKNFKSELIQLLKYNLPKYTSFSIYFFLFEPNLRDRTQVTVALLEIQLPFYTS